MRNGINQSVEVSGQLLVVGEQLQLVARHEHGKRRNFTEAAT
jgi:D-Tyr-tRNAtyr deacylase